MSLLLIYCALVILCGNSIFCANNSSLDRRIIGGTPADILFFPYQVSLQDNEGHLCGGSIIHQSYILTAAHCLEDENIKSLRVRAGSHFSNNGGVVKRVCAAASHKSYIGDDDYDYDIAIVKLCSPLIYGETILPIALPEFNELINSTTPAIVTGWGVTTANGTASPARLQKVSLAIYNQTICRNKYNKLGTITPRMLCAGCLKGVCDACQGDSGGPLVAKGKLVGIVSWGYGCADKNYPGVYSRVAKFRKWIKNKIRI